MTPAAAPSALAATAAPVFVDRPGLAGHWYVVAEGTDVADAPLAVRLLGADYVLWRSADGAVVGAPDRCPHREAPLSAGTVTAGELACPYHGWSFGDDGRCVAIPSADPSTPVPPTAHLPTVHVEERYGLVWLCPGEPVGRVPVISHDDDPAFRRINTGVEVWRTSATRMTDNFLDFSHFPWVHTGTFGRGQDPRIPHLDLGELPDGWFGYAYEVDADNPDEAKVTSTSDDPTVHRWMTTGFHLPFTVRSTIRYADGLEHILLLVSTPIDDVTAYFTFVVWRNDDFSVDPQEVVAFDRAIGAEDKVMLERVPGVLPLTQTGVVSVQADKASVEWRRRLIALMDA